MADIGRAGTVKCGRVGTLLESWFMVMGHGSWPSSLSRVGPCNDNLFLSMTTVIKMLILKLFQAQFYFCVVFILTYLYRHTICGPTLPGMAQVALLLGRVRSGELFLITFFSYAT